MLENTVSVEESHRGKTNRPEKIDGSLEAEWKTELAQRDHALVEELMGNTVEDSSGIVEELSAVVEESAQPGQSPEKYLVTA